MIITILDLIKLLDGKQKRIFYLIILVSIFAAISEMLSLALIVPLASYILGENQNTSTIHNILNNTYFEDNIPTDLQIIYLTGFFILSSIILKSINVVLSQRYVLKLEAYLGTSLLTRILKANYSQLLKVGSANYTKILTTEINQLIYQGYFPLLGLFTNIFCVISILIILFYTNWIVASIIFIIFA